MTWKKAILLSLMSAMTLSLAACGGGGGSTSTASNTGTTGTNNGSNTPVVQYTPPNTSVAAPTYPALSAESAFFADVNAMRGASNLSLLAQNAALDTSAQAHALYLGQNYNASTMGGVIDPSTGLLYAHSEDVGMPGYDAPTPQGRATKAGYSGIAPEVAIAADSHSTPVSDTADVGDESFNSLMNTVYHRGAMMQDALRDIGIGYTQPYEFVVDMGYTGVPQPPAESTLVPYPPSQGTDPYPFWMAGFESPDPTPSLAVGTPLGGAISIESATNSQLTVGSFKLLDAGGSVVPCYEMDSSNDPNKDYIWSNQAFLIPHNPLNLGSSYTAVFSGTIDGVAAQKTWTFNTPSPQLTQVTPGPFVLRNGGSLTIRVKAPSGSTGFTYSYTGGIPGSTLQASVTQESITLTLAPNAVTSTTGISLTASDLYYPSVSPTTIQITVTP